MIFFFLPDQWTEKRGHTYLVVSKTHAVKKKKRKKRAQSVRKAMWTTLCKKASFMYNICFAVSSLCLLPCSPWVTLARDDQDSWALSSSYLYSVEKELSVTSIRKETDRDRKSQQLHFGWVRKEIPGVLPASSTTAQSVAPDVLVYMCTLGLGNPLT